MCLLSSSYTWSASPLLLTEATSRAVKPSWRDIEARKNKREGGREGKTGGERAGKNGREIMRCKEKEGQRKIM